MSGKSGYNTGIIVSIQAVFLTIKLKAMSSRMPFQFQNVNETWRRKFIKKQNLKGQKLFEEISSDSCHYTSILAFTVIGNSQLPTNIHLPGSFYVPFQNCTGFMTAISAVIEKEKA